MRPERLKRPERSPALALGLVLTAEVPHALVPKERALCPADLPAVRAEVAERPHWSGKLREIRILSKLQIL